MAHAWHVAAGSDRSQWTKAMQHCDYAEYYTAWDNNGDIVIVSLENFFADDVYTQMQKSAVNAKWEKADIHKSKLDGKLAVSKPRSLLPLLPFLIPRSLLPLLPFLIPCSLLPLLPFLRERAMCCRF